MECVRWSTNAQVWWRWSFCCVLLLATILNTCTAQSAFSFCDNVDPVSDTEIALTFQPGSSRYSQCTCQLTPKNGQALLSLTMRLEQLSEDMGFSSSSRNVSCEPFTALTWGSSNMVSQCVRTENEGDANRTPTGDGDEFRVVESMEESRFMVEARDFESISITLHNHKLRDIVANVMVKVEVGHIDVQCRPEISSSKWTSELCPCDEKMLEIPDGYFNNRESIVSAGNNETGGMPEIVNSNPTRYGDGNRAVVAVVCVVIFLLIVAVIAGIWWWRKKRTQGDEKDLERVTADNQAYSASTNASRASGLDREPQPTSGPVQYNNVPSPGFGNEELDLSLRTAPNKPGGPNKGSVDSGVYSMPNEKPPHAPANNNYANVPLGPDQMYNPMLAKQPSVPSLTGQGALHGSVDHLNPPDVVYAQPDKGRRYQDRNVPPARSASHDALNQTPAGGDMSAARSRSHNASMASLSVETDV